MVALGRNLVNANDALTACGMPSDLVCGSYTRQASLRGYAALTTGAEFDYSADTGSPSDLKYRADSIVENSRRGGSMRCGDRISSLLGR